ncbi:hypothetical protein IQ266_18650, partial [filamentous cyanobacterium LEGE 11480]
MEQGINQSHRFHPPERMCKDLRSMQLFAERVLGYRLGKDPSEFRSFGFHEPNTDEGRQVYTIVDDRVYYFLPKLNTDAVHRAFNNLQHLIDDNFGFAPAIQQIVIVGESSTADDRERLQEAVNNYRFATQSNDSQPTELPPPSEKSAIPDHDRLDHDNTNTVDGHPVTLLPSTNTKPIVIRKALSYINEDPY